VKRGKNKVVETEKDEEKEKIKVVINDEKNVGGRREWDEEAKVIC
jgi:hypothetical protein